MVVTVEDLAERAFANLALNFVSVGDVVLWGAHILVSIVVEAKIIGVVRRLDERRFSLLLEIEVVNGLVLKNLCLFIFQKVTWILLNRVVRGHRENRFFCLFLSHVKLGLDLPRGDHLGTKSRSISLRAITRTVHVMFFGLLKHGEPVWLCLIWRQNQI